MKKQILAYTKTLILTLDNTHYPYTDIKTIYCNKTRINSDVVKHCRYHNVEVVELKDNEVGMVVELR